MARFTKESVQRLRDTVDIVALISRYIPLKKAGVTYKARCPFHDEKTPSFTVSAVTKHYHCFGCGAHGDAVSFLMNYERLGFLQALEFLSERFNVPLDIEQEDSYRGVPKGRLKNVLEAATLFFHTMLLFSDVAKHAREYLMKRGFSLQFLEAFRIGYAPDNALRGYLHAEGYSDKELEEAGLLSVKSGREREFFTDRIMFPVLDVMGSPIGFSARKYKEETFGGKYINTPETLLFKKSKILFGLFYSKKRMAKEKIACIVEGQLDALRLIESGFDFTVATLGTAFGVAHVDQLRAIGVEEVFLAFDQDEAGQASSEKSGDLLMKKGIGVKVLSYSGAKDPDEFLSIFGKKAFFQELTKSEEYLEFLVEKGKRERDWSSPVEKDRSVRAIAEKIAGWENPVMKYEAYKKLARLANVPESLFGEAPTAVEPVLNNITAKKEPENTSVEIDLLRGLICSEVERADVVQLCETVLTPEDFTLGLTRELFILSVEQLKKGEGVDLLRLASDFESDAVTDVLKKLFAKKPVPGKAYAIVSEAATRIRQRNWLAERESIRKKMEEPGKSDDELLELAKQFDALANRQ